jgi:hypothetical protein
MLSIAIKWLTVVPSTLTETFDWLDNTSNLRALGELSCNRKLLGRGSSDGESSAGIAGIIILRKIIWSFVHLMKNFYH